MSDHNQYAVTKQTTPTGVLRSLAVITDQRDRDLLASTLVSTLPELIHSKHILLYRIVSGEQGAEAILVAQSSDPHEADGIAETEEIIDVAERADFTAVLNSQTEYITALDDNSFLSIYPIVGRHGIVGLLETISDAHTEMDKHLILAFLKVYSNYLTVLDESETDTLTGLLNRRTFDNNIEKIIAERPASNDIKTDSNQPYPVRRSQGTDLTHWLAVMDIDHFKLVNDKFGHLYGDEVLLLLSRHMRSIFRHRDKLFRFGGEEFVVVLDQTTLESAKLVLERFRAAIENFHFPQVGRVTVSIGFVRLDKFEVPSAIVGRADQALYHAKHHGRNQVCFYEDLITEGDITEEQYSDDLQLF
jgi:diguanylate cyclase (GGDEF)-like protein